MESSSDSFTPSSSEAIFKRKSNDIGWEYGMLVDSRNLDKVKCKLCGKVMSGGAYRIKEHVAHIVGNVSACPKASMEDQAKCKQVIMEGKNKKKSKHVKGSIERSKMNVEEDDVVNQLRTREKPPSRGPMDNFFSTTNHNVSASEECEDIVSQQEQLTSHDLLQERRDYAKNCVSRWMYEAGIPFDAIECNSFIRCMQAIGEFGPGFRGPNEYELQGPLLKDAVKRMQDLIKKQEVKWEENGCSIVIDVWTDEKKQTLMNLFVNCSIGTTFQCANKCLKKTPTSEFIFQYVNKYIEQVGAHRVVQVIANNATNNSAVSKLLKEKRPTIFLTSCATDAINLMLEKIGELPTFKEVIDEAKAFTTFIYAQKKALKLKKSFIKEDIVRLGVTRFASSFLTLQSLADNKSKLEAMFESIKSKNCKLFKTIDGKLAYLTLKSTDFWNGVTMCLKVFAPLVKVLRLVHIDEKPSMGFLYGELKQAKEDIKVALENVESNYRSIIEIIDDNMKGRLDSPLHLLAYSLNPYYFFNDMSVRRDPDVQNGILECLDALFPNDIDMQHVVVNIEFHQYREQKGTFGKEIVRRGCKNNDEHYDPVVWWSTYGFSTPNLQKIAMRILSLTTSSFVCERNRSRVETVHAKINSRVDLRRFNNLLFVQLNSKLRNKENEIEENEVDALLLEYGSDSNVRGWINEGDYNYVDDDDDEEKREVDGINFCHAAVPSKACGTRPRI